MELGELYKKAGCLSKSEREFITKTELIDWRQPGKEYKTILHELAYMKKLELNLNSKNLTREQIQNNEHPIINISEEKLDYMIRVA